MQPQNDWQIWKHFRSDEDIAKAIEQFLEKESPAAITYNAMQLAVESEGKIPYQELLSFAKITAILEFAFCERQSIFSSYLGRRKIESDITLFECGAHQGHDFFHQMSGAITWLFAAKNLFDVPFFAYDPEVTREMLKTIEANTIGREGLHPCYTPEIFAKIREMTLDSYAELETKVRAINSPQLPVLISKGVLNAPFYWIGHQEFRPDAPFWKLPGFHIHNVDIEELGKNRRVANVNDVVEGRKNTTHLASLCDAMQIHPSAIGCYFDRCFSLDSGITGNPFEATYFWINK